MKAVRMYAPGDLRVEEVSIPEIEKDEVLVKVMAVGICGSDIPRANKYGAHVSPIILGHEFGGVIVKKGEEAGNFEIGDHVTATPLIPCYSCHWCREGQYSLCDHYDYYGSRRDGAMAQYIAVKTSNLLKVDRNVPFEDIATVDPCANALHAMFKAGFQPGEMSAFLEQGQLVSLLCSMQKYRERERSSQWMYGTRSWIWQRKRGQIMSSTPCTQMSYRK